VLFIIGITAFINSGCSNHLRNIDIVTQDNERKIISLKYDLKFTPETIKDSTYHVEINKFESAEVKNFNTRTVRSISTPYKFWRELYEVPCGVLLLPVSIGSHLLCICTLGIFPYDIPYSVTCTTFTGLNPFLNWESDSRNKEELVSLERKLISQKIEHSKTPIAKQNIIVKSGTRTKVYRTDDFGTFELNFLSTDDKISFFPKSRKITFILANNEKTVLKNMILTRDYLSKLIWSRSKINAYKYKPTGKKLFETVVYLENNGFKALAYQLEENELLRYKNNKFFHKEFNSAASIK
jgi:hypothetical protein